MVAVFGNARSTITYAKVVSENDRKKNTLIIILKWSSLDDSVSKYFGYLCLFLKMHMFRV